MKRIGLYIHQNNYIELFFLEDSLEFKASWRSETSPAYSTPLEALNFCRRSIEIDVAYDYELEECGSIYKKLIDPTEAKVCNNFDLLDKEMWSLDYSFAKWALPRVLYFKIFCSEHGTPGDFVEILDNGEQIVYEDEWEEVLTKIITALRLIVYDCTTVEKDSNQKIEEGLKLFSVYIRAMWT